MRLVHEREYRSTLWLSSELTRRAQLQDVGKVGNHRLASCPPGLRVRSRRWARSAEGVSVGEHGSWNRGSPAGYRVIFVPFRGGRPSGNPIEFVTGFIADGKARGRPVGVTVDPRGALIVADDVANTVWRVAPIVPIPAAP